MINNEELLNNVIDNLHKLTLAIPILNEYKEIPIETNAIMTAESEDHSIEQFLEDGKLEENESFQNRLQKVLKETQEEMERLGFEKKELKYLETFKGNLFEYELYLQDSIKDKKQVRQINAYFLEPEGRYFYEVTLSAPPMPASMVNDFVTTNIYQRLKIILTNIKYNEQNPIK